MMFRAKLKDKIFEEKLQTHVELIRRKLDFEVIKDNHENNVTQEILDRFTDLKAGMPGTTFKYQRIAELLKRRRDEMEKTRQEEKLKRDMEREMKRERTDKGRRKIELKYEARKSQSAARTARPLMSKKTLNEQALEAGTESYFFDQKQP